MSFFIRMRPAFSNKLNEPKIELDKGQGQCIDVSTRGRAGPVRQY
ncbi:Uncharacterised protein [Vibrio cholerae]|nr:Uncharacterised protein [Vibrio cholerae]